MKPHKHAEVIKAWADGAEIEFFSYGELKSVPPYPQWNDDIEYRIKPKEPIVQTWFITALEARIHVDYPNVKFTFNPETKELISVEKI